MQLEVCEWREAQMNSVAEILMPGELVMHVRNVDSMHGF